MPPADQSSWTTSEMPLRSSSTRQEQVRADDVETFGADAAFEPGDFED